MVKFGLSAYSVLFLALFLQFTKQAKEGYSKVDIKWFDFISAILRTELSGYNTVGEEIRIVWMGFNEGWVQV